MVRQPSMSFSGPSGDPGLSPLHTISQELTRPGSFSDARTASGELAASQDGTAFPNAVSSKGLFPTCFSGVLVPKYLNSRMKAGRGSAPSSLRPCRRATNSDTDFHGTCGCRLPSSGTTLLRSPDCMTYGGQVAGRGKLVNPTLAR